MKAAWQCVGVSSDADIVIELADTDDMEGVIARRFEFLREVRGGVELDADFIRATRHFMRGEFDAGRLRSWIARDGDACIGVVSMLLWPRPPRPGDPSMLDGYVINMHVEPTLRRGGLGRRLLDACLADADTLGVGRVQLHTTDDGRALYESAGFAANERMLERQS